MEYLKFYNQIFINELSIKFILNLIRENIYIFYERRTGTTGILFLLVKDTSISDKRLLSTLRKCSDRSQNNIEF